MVTIFSRMGKIDREWVVLAPGEKRVRGSFESVRLGSLSRLRSMNTSLRLLRDTYMRLEMAVNLSKTAVATVASMVLTLLGGSIAFAEGADPGGAEFVQAAIEYREQAEVARETGNEDAATIYDRLAEIKDTADQLANEGRWDEIDWTEYHALTADLSQISK